MSRTLSVEVWSDIACPWCYVGKRRLEAALSRFAHAERVAVTWRAFELDPGAPAVRDSAYSYVTRLAKKYGTSEVEAQGMIQRMVELAAQDGLAFDFTQIRPGNTFNAHRLLHLAKQRGLQGALKERLFRAYLCEGQAIGDGETLLRLATEVGLEADEVQALLSSDLYAAEVRGEQREAQAIGIDGVPFFVLARRYAVAGAQPAELLVQALEKAWEQGSGTLEPGTAEGPVCGPDGCD